jgi:hypothetical protein
MPWFVALRPIVSRGALSGKHEYRVFSESQIEGLTPEWDWASGACDTEEEAQQAADEQFWDEFEG